PSPLPLSHELIGLTSVQLLDTLPSAFFKAPTRSSLAVGRIGRGLTVTARRLRRDGDRSHPYSMTSSALIRIESGILCAALCRVPSASGPGGDRREAQRRDQCRHR